AEPEGVQQPRAADEGEPREGRRHRRDREGPDPDPAARDEEILRGAGAANGPDRDAGDDRGIGERDGDDARRRDPRKRRALQRKERAHRPEPPPDSAARTARIRSMSASSSVIRRKVRAYASGRTNAGRSPMP